MAEIVALLIKYWYIGVFIILGAIIGFQKIEIGHYKEKAATFEATIQLANAKEAELEKEFNAQTLKYKESLKNQFALQAAQGEVVAERIKKDEASKHIVVSHDAVELFNASKPPTPEATTATVSGNDAGASSAQKTLNDLLLVTDENDTNHLKCIATVHEWQNFWKDTTMKYKLVVNDEAP